MKIDYHTSKNHWSHVYESVSCRNLHCMIYKTEHNISCETSCMYRLFSGVQKLRTTFLQVGENDEDIPAILANQYTNHALHQLDVTNSNRSSTHSKVKATIIFISNYLHKTKLLLGLYDCILKHHAVLEGLSVITLSRAKKLQQQVNSLLNKFNSTSNENLYTT